MGRKQSKSTAQTEPKSDWLEQLTSAFDAEWFQFRPESDFPKLDKAILEKAREDPEGLMSEAIGMMIAFELRILIRTQWVVSRWLSEWDKRHFGSPMEAPGELADAVDQMARIEDHVTNLMARHARLRHVAGLAEETKAVRGTARKLRESLRVLAHPVLPQIEIAAGEEATKEHLEKAG
jgi:hypothetical protein